MRIAGSVHGSERWPHVLECYPSPDCPRHHGSLLAIHRHGRDKGVAREFTRADQLLKDFFDEVDRVLDEARK